MTRYVVYNDTGLILHYGDCPDSMLADQEFDGRKVAVGDGGADTHYVLNGVVTPRPANPTTISGNVLSNLPNPSQIEIDGTKYDCTDTTATITFPQPGLYSVTVTAFPYLPVTFGISQ